MKEIIQKLNKWLVDPNIESELKSELSELLDSYNKNKSDKTIKDEIKDRFYKDMEFGTGGLRGKIGAGTNRMNIHTVGRVSQAFSQHLLTKNDVPSVVIAYDNRKYSDLFAFESACVFAANGIKVWIFKELTPTPMLSYAVRNLKATGGIVVTASHNPKEYNGYKIYDENGCQCLPPEAKKVSDFMDRIDLFRDISSCTQDYSGDLDTRVSKAVLQNDQIGFVPSAVTESYFDEVMNEKAFSGSLENVNMVYTPLNGTGNIPVTRVLESANVGQLYKVKIQESPDPDFTTCPKPNPEENEALTEGLKLCSELEKEGDTPDFLLATDPDCDRVGIMVRDSGSYKRLDGNQVGILLFDYLIESLKRKDLMPEKPVLITTIVSTPMVSEIAYKNRIHVDRVLTGFKFIGDRIDRYDAKGEVQRFIFGFEESCGYLAGTYARDKDAVSSSLLVADMVGYYKANNKTLIDRMDELYQEYGYFISSQKNLERTGPEGAKEIVNIMAALRNPEILADFSQDVIQFLDYEEQTKRTMGLFDGEDGGCAMAVGTRPINGLPKENVLEFNFKNRSKVTIRPSGTEPKIKIYFSVVSEISIDAEKNMTVIQNEFMKLVEKL